MPRSPARAAGGIRQRAQDRNALDAEARRFASISVERDRAVFSWRIVGKLTGLHSRAMTGPDGKIRIPINEDAGDQGQIEGYLKRCAGEGIQHVAIGAHNLYTTIEALMGIQFVPAPNQIYYSRIDQPTRRA